MLKGHDHICSYDTLTPHADGTSAIYGNRNECWSGESCGRGKEDTVTAIQVLIRYTYIPYIVCGVTAWIFRGGNTATCQPQQCLCFMWISLSLWVPTSSCLWLDNITDVLMIYLIFWKSKWCHTYHSDICRNILISRCRCWSFEPKYRPTFRGIYTQLGRLYSDILPSDMDEEIPLPNPIILNAAGGEFSVNFPWCFVFEYLNVIDHYIHGEETPSGHYDQDSQHHCVPQPHCNDDSQSDHPHHYDHQHPYDHDIEPAEDERHTDEKHNRNESWLLSLLWHPSSFIRHRLTFIAAPHISTSSHRHGLVCFASVVTAAALSSRCMLVNTSSHSAPLCTLLFSFSVRR